MQKFKEKFTVSESGDGFEDMVDKMWVKLPEGDYTVYVFDVKKNRALAANRYYWGVVLKTISEHTGDSVDDLHEIFKSMFNKKRVTLLKDGDEFEIGESTKNLDTQKFMDYTENIRIWSLENIDTYIPLPQEVAQGDEYLDLYAYATDAKV